jgi:uncharacterized repeat protein (TIGR04076 family)
MGKCKITVIKRDYHQDLAGEYCNSSTKFCPVFNEGDIFYAKFGQPEKFCGWAWNDIYRVVTTLMSGGNYSRGEFEGWMKRDNEMIACCTDGIRPVTFKIEYIEE